MKLKECNSILSVKVRMLWEDGDKIGEGKKRERVEITIVNFGIT